MKDRILFWMDAAIVHFGIAKFLQERYDSELFAIYDVDRPLQKSFMNQKIVNFQKEWYVMDSVSQTTKQPDLDYLKSFEEKYKINLWQVIYTSKLFFRYQYYKFKYNEILSILEQECKFFENVLDEIKPDFLIIRLTDSHKNHLFVEMCKVRGIKVLMLIYTRFGYRSLITTDVNKIDDFYDAGNNSELENISETDLEEYLKKYNKFQYANKIEDSGIGLPIIKKIKPVLRWFTKSFDDEYRNSYNHYGVTRLGTAVNRATSDLRGRYRKFFIDRNFVHEIADNEKFVYFPLHVEPERTVLIGAPFYTNQLEVIINIAKSLPVGYKLYVKEHFSMKFRHWRNISYYKTILDLPNVKLIHPSVKPEEMLKKCSLVITITGTTGVEAAFYKKPSIVFTDVDYSVLPSVYRLRSFEELPQVIRTSLQRKVNLSDLKEYVNLLNRNSFEFDAIGLSNKVLHKFHYGGFLVGENISLHELDSFLNENKEIFEKLALEHIKKIRYYKQYQFKN